MVSYRHFFSDLPDEYWHDLPRLYDELQADIESGVFLHMQVIYQADTYSSYVQHAKSYFANLEQHKLDYPELFI